MYCHSGRSPWDEMRKLRAGTLQLSAPLLLVSQPQATADLPSVTVDYIFCSRITYNWSHTVCTFLYLAPFTQKKKKKSPNRIFHVICISSLFLFIAGKYFIVWLYQLCLFVHSFISWLTFELFPIFGYYVSGQTMQFLVWIYVSFSPLLLCYPLNLYPKSFSMASLRTFLHLHFLAASVASYWYFPFNLPTILILFKKKKIKSNQTNNCFLTMTPHWR